MMDIDVIETPETDRERKLCETIERLQATAQRHKAERDEARRLFVQFVRALDVSFDGCQCWGYCSCGHEKASAFVRAALRALPSA